MDLTTEDRSAVRELLALHGHLFDDGELHRLDELFTDDVVYDVTDFGAPEPLRGLAALRDAALALGAANPVAHHVTNVVLEVSGEEVHARSKGLGVHADGSCGSVTYEDVVVRTPHGWRIRHRTVRARRTPLGGG